MRFGKINTSAGQVLSINRRNLMTLRNINLNLDLGQEILVGKNGERAKITKIEFHEKTGEVSLNTTRGPRKAFTFRLCHDLTNSGVYTNPADRYR